MKPPWHRIVLFLALCVACQSAPALARSVAELYSEQRLQVSSELIPATNIVPGQQVKLVVKIATDRWFTGGTRLKIPEVAGLVILQTDQFASNTSENRGGQSWVVQRWSLEIYPQRNGSFTIPPIDIRVEVNGGDDGSVEGILHSQALQFNATRPESLGRAEHWVAAPSYTVSQRFDRVPVDLHIGDAIEREIVFEASDTMAMMLPGFSIEQLPGLRAYPEPPVLNNTSNRGTMTARRIERISYVVEREGRYQLPSQDYFWWDTRTGESQLLSIPAVEVVAGPGAVSTLENPTSRNISPRQLLLALALLASVLPVFILANKYLSRIPMGEIGAALRRVGTGLAQLRKPALPARLNPDRVDVKGR
ncbi:MAG: hypothetical protein HOC23_01180 [Halieaceae bacterium]|jgi:hypothetical protein|nr:hypothetical protein [Halieaceae bacterium]